MGRRMRLFRMPSSSRAYPRPLEEKAAIYRGDVRGAGDGVMNHYLLIQNALPLQGTEL